MYVNIKNMKKNKIFNNISNKNQAHLLMPIGEYILVFNIKTNRMNSKRKITGWVVTVLACLAPAWGVIGKFISSEMQSNMASIGFEPYTKIVAIGELIAVVLFIIPRTGRIGSLLMTALMGGAIASHLGHGQSIGLQTTVLILVWIATLIRYPEFLDFNSDTTV